MSLKFPATVSLKFVRATIRGLIGPISGAAPMFASSPRRFAIAGSVPLASESQRRVRGNAEIIGRAANRAFLIRMALDVRHGIDDGE